MTNAKDVERWLTGALKRRGIQGYKLDTFEESAARTDIAVFNETTDRGHMARFDAPFDPTMIDRVADFVAEKVAEAA